MCDLVAGFLDVATFASWAKRTDWSTDQLATSLLTVVSDWIRDHKPDIADDDPAAKVATFEVTRDAMLYGDFGPMVSSSKGMGPRSKSGTIDRAAVERFITDRHRRMLRIPLRAAARGNFKRSDY